MKISTLGFGEAAYAFVSGWRETPPFEDVERISTFDIKIEDPASKTVLMEACDKLRVECATDRNHAFANSDVIFSVVTADQAQEAAISVADDLEENALFFDCNSCSPATKVAVSKVLGKRGVRYVDVAVMAPVYPAKHMTPLLISGCHAQAAIPILEHLGMQANIAGEEVGQASTIKMLRSVMVKGLEALTAECLLAARKAGVEERVLASLQQSQPGIEWQTRSSYNLERMMVHGKRRAAEMREVAATLSELGLPNRMAMSAMEWHDEIGALLENPGPDDLGQRADILLRNLYI
ncbi:putative oxidoreductase [Agrobacterium fabacearum S56]|uniref:NAD(P)-dependent oxidoreductase n=1 Tax=Agrobacterium tumefaciens TaxID=358 RepID=UPI0009BC0CFB|nr:DUF1932 domain-containing protein [Agrobacterium tumefaciens]CUX06888.1 putative oxidoreductase [Agrobacterium fabacearum S56]